MKKFVLSAAVSAALVCAAAGPASAADIIPTKAPPAPDAGPTSCTSVWDFFATTCQLSYYGVRFYGTIDIGGGWDSHGAPYNPNAFFTFNLIQKAGNNPLWLISPDNIAQSNVGVQGKEQIFKDWFLVFDLEAGFNPYSFQLANGPGTVAANVGVPLTNQNSNGDSARAGQFYNALGFVGISSPTYGTLTVFRQTSLLFDGVIAYDPMGGAYAFSPIGFSGVAAGGGDTEDTRYTTSLKYRVNVGQMRFGALWQFGGYGQGNGSQGAYQATMGGDIANVAGGVVSFDAVGSYVQNAVSIGLAGNPLNGQGQPVAPFLPQNLTATITNNAAAMALAKYTVGPLKLYGGYEFIQYNPPTGTISPFTDIAGTPISTISTTAVGAAGASDKVLEIMWTGAKYTVIKNLDVIGAYYHYTQNSFIAGASCNTSASSKCFGTLDAVSVALDWQFAAKADAYIGAMFSQVNGGLSNGYLSRNNLDPTAGLRFRF